MPLPSYGGGYFFEFMERSDIMSGKNSKKKKTLSKFAKRSARRQKSKKSVSLNGAFFKGAHKRKQTQKKQVQKYTGIFSATSRGFGFVKCDAFDDDIFIPAAKTMNAMGGDEVEFIIKGRTDGARIDGEVTDIISRKNDIIVGHIEECVNIVRRGGKNVKVNSFVFLPDNTKQISFPVRISVSKAKGAQGFDRVGIKILAYPTADKEAIGEVEMIFGKVDDPQSAALAVLYTNGIATEFPDEVKSEAEDVISATKNTEKRVDLRDKVIFTIDSEYAKDLDDAISVEYDGEHYTLGVHIADVSEYVGEETALDREAKSRGTSVYYPGHVIPMLPEAISNGVCSLNRDSDKLALSAMIKLDKAGEILSCDVFESIISSAARGVYSELNAILDKTASSEIKKKYPKAVLDTLKLGARLYKVLLKKSEKRGSFELESDEAIILFDDKGVPCNVIKEERGITERLIEQFMICANEAVAKLSCANKIPGIFRIHEKPATDKLTTLLEYVENIGIDTRKYKKEIEGLTGKHMQKLLLEAADKDALRAVSEVLLRSMMKAKYSPAPSYHYGLALEYYSHFTSPIRRYADLALHRSLKEAIRKKGSPLHFEGDVSSQKYASNPAMAEASEAANEGELRALSAERAIDDIYKAFCMKDKLGEEFDAMIISVLSFGFFVSLDNTCEGLVPVSSLGGLGSYSEEKMRLEDAYGNTYSVGTRVRVRLVDVNISSGKLTFDFIEKAEVPKIDKSALS